MEMKKRIAEVLLCVIFVAALLFGNRVNAKEVGDVSQTTQIETQIMK